MIITLAVIRNSKTRITNNKEKLQGTKTDWSQSRMLDTTPDLKGQGKLKSKLTVHKQNTKSEFKITKWVKLELDYQISSTMIDTCDLKLHGIHFKNACTNAKRCDSERAAFNLRADGNLPESHLSVNWEIAETESFALDNPKPASWNLTC